MKRAKKDNSLRFKVITAVWVVFIFVAIMLTAVPVKASAADSLQDQVIRLDLSGDTLQFGGFPSLRDVSDYIDADQFKDGMEDEDELLNSLYEKVEGAVAGLSGKVDVSGCGLTQEEAAIIVSDVLNAEPRYFYVEGASVVIDSEDGTVDSILIDYAADSEAVIAEYENAVAKILSGVDQRWNDEEKIFYLHDYIVTHCEYDYVSYNSGNTKGAATAYAAIIKKLAVCSGYSSAFSDLANRLGIETSFISSDKMNHAWNLVTLNSKHYFLDCTWDDPGTRAWYSCSHKNLLLSQTGITATGHDSKDWVASYKESTVYGLYDDKTYDDADWHDADFSPVVCLSDRIIYLNKNGRIYAYGCNASDPQVIIDEDSLGRWPAWGQAGSYSQTFGTMTACGDGVFFNDSDHLYKLNVTGKTYDTVYTLSESEASKGQIFGISSEGTFILYDIGTTRNAADKVTDGRFDVSSSVNYIALDKSLITFEDIKGSATIRATVSSNNAPAVTWSSSDTSVATVTGGVVTPVGYGSALITATSGNLRAGCRVNVDTTWQKDYTYSGRFPGTSWEDQWRYVEAGFSMKITGYNGEDKSITIPSSAVMDGRKFTVTGIEISGDAAPEEMKLASGMELNSFFIKKCSTLKKADLSGADVSKLTDLSHVFSGCTKLSELNLSGWDTGAVTTLYNMFGECGELTSLDLSGWDTSSVTNMGFVFNKCAKLESINLNGWDTKAVTSMEAMFYNCASLKTLDISSFNTAAVKDMQYMFAGCKEITALDLSHFNTSKVTNMNDIFRSCTKLEQLDLDGWDMGKVGSGDGYAQYMLGGDTALMKIVCPKNLKFDVKLPNKLSDAEGNEYTTLPKNLKSSITITKHVPVTSISIYEGDSPAGRITMKIGEERTLRAVVEPQNADADLVVWTSSDPSSVSVSNKGVISALKDAEDVKITASVPADNKSASIYVTVNTKLEGVSIDPHEDKSVAIGSKLNLKYVVKPEGASVTSAVWKSSSPSVASVDDKGVVTAKAEGEADISITLDDKYSDSIKVKVVDKIVPIVDILLDKNTMELNAGDSEYLHVTKDPIDSTDVVSYLSGNSKVATVDENGLVKGMSEGETDITVTCGELKKTCHVRVYDRLTGISFRKSSYSIGTDETVNIPVVIAPSGFKAAIHWDVTGDKDAVSYTVSTDGTYISITGLYKGKVTVTATATDASREPVITKQASCSVTVAGSQIIEPVKGLTVEGLEKEYIYLGQPVVPDVLIYYDGIRLVGKKEYTIKCINNKEPGTAYMSIKGTGNYAGTTAALSYKIVEGKAGDVSIKKAVVSGIAPKYTFTGDPITIPDLRVSLDGNELTENEDYLVSYQNHIDAGRASVVISGMGDYKDTITKKFEIAPADIRAVYVDSLSSTYMAGGAKIYPELKYLTDNGSYTLKYGVDYKLEWSRNNKPGNGTLAIYGKGNFTKRSTRNFTIAQGNLNDTVMVLQSKQFKADQKGSSYMAKVKIYDVSGKTLTPDKDYALEYYDETKGIIIDKTTPKGAVGYGDLITVVARPGSKGNYKGSVRCQYYALDTSIPITKVTVTSIPVQEYTGEEIRPQVTIGGLTEGIDYEVSAYYNNVRKGTATVLIRGKYRYSGYRLIKFKIIPKSLSVSL